MGGFAVGLDKGLCGQDVRIDEVAHVHEVVDVLAVAHLKFHLALFRAWNHLSQADAIGFADGCARTHGDCEHGAVASFAVGSYDIFFRCGFGESVDAFLDRWAENGQGLIRVD